MSVSRYILTGPVGSKSGLMVLVGLVVVLLFSREVRGQSLIETIDYETGDLSQWKNPSSSNHDGSITPAVVASPVRSGFFSGHYVMLDGRTESAAQRIPLETEIWAGWSLFIPQSLPDAETGTVSQFIGYQPPDFEGGNYHVKISGGSWGVWMRNIGANSADVLGLRPVQKEEWTDLFVHARFSYTNGFFTLYIRDSEGEQRFDLIESGQTFVDAPLGPYFKAGLYAGFSEGSDIFVDEYRVCIAGQRRDVDPAMRVSAGVPELLSIQPESRSRFVRLAWSSIPGAAYQVFGSRSLSPWTPSLLTAVSANDNFAGTSIPMGGDSSWFFTVTPFFTGVVDRFDNGAVEDSDSIAGFWSVYANAGYSAATESGSALTLSAFDASSKRATLLSDSVSAADFWSNPVSLKINEFSYSHAAGVQDGDTIFHFGLTAHGVAVSMRNMKTVFSVSLRANGSLVVGWKAEVGLNPEDGTDLLDTVVLDTALIDSVELQLDGTGSQLVWSITLGRDGVYETYSDMMSATDTFALKTEWASAERYRVAVEGQSGGSVNTSGEYVRFEIGEVILEAGLSP
ncbi:heparin lyase I family protein [Tichowtungia aerotolerans]|uniref:Uncharacterized protein n=1 Tax=Tichowtungia aerotolerans TaxID=2697043 RepID=A0A6P1M3H6_9BACT|nr:heparin lyase I family protein [Tichowtungia aerotolerans]QHI69160.1 hypothetical protein GT409_06750 [Tichowtungia aerotolerans]